ncbi:MAG: lytic transglycosylase [Deltaproteobacteria bacterium]|nr:MAG: lytic transglycosylase [Deltaproteobacteria bacterium]
MGKTHLGMRSYFFYFLAFLILNGCSGSGISSFIFPDHQADTLGRAGNSNPEEDPDLALEPAEDKEALSEELETLKQTGEWENKDTADAPEPEKEDQKGFPIVHNKQVDAYIKIFTGSQRKQFARWLATSGRYAPIVYQELDRFGLPRELLYLAMIESGFNQRARSAAKAVGLWQFMRSTGRQYSLRIDNYIDERRDAKSSSEAAASFLSDLYGEFGDWYLAVAAYNAGPGKIRKGLNRYKADNFWDLAQHNYLRLETKRYVPKLIAAIIIAKDPEKYGFHNLVYKTPLKYDVLEVGPGLDFNAIALISGQNVKEIKELNLELKKGRTPLNRKSHLVKIPAGSLQYAKANMGKLHNVVKNGYKIHIYKSGETLSAICRRYNIDKTTLLKVNNLKSGKINNGKRLRIPYTTVAYQLLSGKGGLPAGENFILHTVRKGETISNISKRYNVSPELIALWNNLPNIHKLSIGQQLALHTDKNGTVKPAGIKPQASRDDNIIVLAENNKRIHHAEPAAKSVQLGWYEVKDGDSLWTISRKFKISPAQIKKWNNLKSNLIRPGVRLKIKSV